MVNSKLQRGATWRSLVFAVICSLIPDVAGCGVEGSATYKPPGVPVEFSVDTSGTISVGIGHEIVTPIGTFGIDVKKPLTPKDEESIVTILHYAGGAAKKSLYTVKLDETLYVDVNGKAHLKFANRSVEVTHKGPLKRRSRSPTSRSPRTTTKNQPAPPKRLPPSSPSSPLPVRSPRKSP